MTDEQLLSSFRHDAGGDWTCIKPIMFDGTAHNVAVMPGTIVKKSDLFLGMDLARELEEAEARQSRSVQWNKPIHH